jgi:hypothetical protein
MVLTGLEDKFIEVINYKFKKKNPATSYFPIPERYSIIGSSRLNFRVRDGNGCCPADRVTGKLIKILI